MVKLLHYDLLLLIKTIAWFEELQMLLNITDFHGQQIGLDPQCVIKLRPATVMGEPAAATMVDFVSGGMFAAGSLRDNWDILGAHVRLALLHAPDGTEVLINADGIAAVLPPDPGYTEAGCIAVVSRDYENERVPTRNRIPFSEKVPEVQAALASAVMLHQGQPPSV